MIYILIMGKTGAALTNYELLRNSIKKNCLGNSIRIISRGDNLSWIKKVKSQDKIIIWMENHLTLIIQIILRIIGSKCGIVIHNPPEHKQTASIVKNFILKTIENISRNLTNDFYFLSNNTKKRCKEKWDGITLSEVFPIDNVNSLIDHKIRNIDIAFVGRNIDYKGLDIFITALDNVRMNLNVTIAGTNTETSAIVKNKKINLTIISKYIPTAEYKEILKDSKFIVLPYRSVSQSGPLSEAYEHNCSVICSNLDYFIECNLSGDNIYFESENAQDLAKKINQIDFCKWEPVFILTQHTWDNVVKKIYDLQKIH